MYSVMIIEDEQVIREGMMQYIPWQEHGFCVKAEASNGLEALEVLEQNSIDLILLDLHMPRLSGIDFLRLFSERNYQSKIVIISGFHEFEYARTAIKYNVMDYLLKPIQVEEVVVLLNKAHRLLEQRNSTEWMEEIDLFKVVNGMYDTDKTQRYLTAMSKRYKGHIFQCAYLTLNKQDQVGVALFKQRINEMLKLTPNLDLFCIVEHAEVGCFVLAIYTGNNFELKEFLVDSDDGASGFKHLIVSSKHDMENLPVRLPPMLNTTEVRFRIFYSDHRVMRLERNRLHQSSDEKHLPNEFMRQVHYVMEAVDTRKDAKVKQALFELYDKLKDIQCPVEEAQALYAELLIQAHLQAEKISGLDGLAEYRQKAMSLIRSLPTLREIRDHTLTIILDLLLYVSNSSPYNKKRRVIAEIIQYVQEHISEPIILSELAEAHYLSSEYLSYLFKKEEGVNFNQYLKEARVKKAIEILRQDYTLRIYEVADRVGYRDPKHFSKVFREVTGLTPKEFIDGGIEMEMGGMPR